MWLVEYNNKYNGRLTFHNPHVLRPTLKTRFNKLFLLTKAKPKKKKKDPWSHTVKNACDSKNDYNCHLKKRKRKRKSGYKFVTSYFSFQASTTNLKVSKHKLACDWLNKIINTMEDWPFIAHMF